MRHLIHLVDEGGWAMLAILPLAALGLLAGIAAMVLSRTPERRPVARRLATISIGVGALAAFLGFAGCASGVAFAFEATRDADASSRATMLAAGVREAAVAAKAGVLLGGIPALLGWLVRRRLPR